MKNLSMKAVMGIIFAVGAGISAFIAEIDSQKKNMKIEDMEKRIDILEKRDLK